MSDLTPYHFQREMENIEGVKNFAKSSTTLKEAAENIEKVMKKARQKDN